MLTSWSSRDSRLNAKNGADGFDDVDDMMNNQGESIIACRVRLINQIRAADSDKDMFSVPSDDDGDLGLGYDQEMDFLMDLEVLCFIVSFTVSVVLIVFRKS